MAKAKCFDAGERDKADYKTLFSLAENEVTCILKIYYNYLNNFQTLLSS